MTIQNIMDTYLHGTHDIGAEALHGTNHGWVVETEGIGLSMIQKGRNYQALGETGYNLIVRLNVGYGNEHGTIPYPHEYDQFAQACAAWVYRSKGCRLWIIGNETNHENERKGGVPIEPEQAADMYARARAAIKKADGGALVAPPAIAPYRASPIKWTDYLRRMLTRCMELGGVDWLAIHAYTRTHAPGDLQSTDKMRDAPLQDTFAGFLTYLDAIAQEPKGLVVPLRVITEFNPTIGWGGNRVVYQGAVKQIANHNAVNPHIGTISGIVAYRFKHDQWKYEDQPDTQADIREAAALGLRPSTSMVETPKKELNLPFVSPGIPQVIPNLPPRDWDHDLDIRGGGAYAIKLVEYQPQPGETYMRIRKAVLLEEKEHIFLSTFDAEGKPLEGITAHIWWDDDGPDESAEITTRNLPPPAFWMADYPMFNAGNSYNLRFRDYAGDQMLGMGLGGVKNPTYTEHVSYAIEAQLVTAPASNTQPAPIPAAPKLVHPVKNFAYREISQVYGRGVNRQYYSQFKVDGVPLEGHNGVDFRTPMGSQIVAVDDGLVVELGYDANGYGEYIKLRHEWGESLYAHLNVTYVGRNTHVGKGQEIALSGNSGKSTGPHLHFGIRINPYNRADGMGGYSDPMPLLEGKLPDDDQEREYWSVLDAIKSAAARYSWQWELLAAQAWAESSFRPTIKRSDTGAMGLFQITQPTWDEWRIKAGVPNEPFNPYHNATVAAAYLNYLFSATGGDLEQSLIAYGWGIGNWLEKKEEAPLAWTIYAAKIIYGKDLIGAVLSQLGIK